MGQHEQVNFVWVAEELRYRPSLEFVDTFLRGLRPGVLEQIKSFVILGKCPWLNLVMMWLKDHFPAERVALFESKVRHVENVEALTMVWPGFELKPTPKIHKRLFGEALETVNEGALPPSILDLISWIATNGLSCEGIFRLSADASTLDWLKSVMNAEKPLDLDRIDPITVACLLKLYFRALPSPIVSQELYPLLCDAHPDALLQTLRLRVLPELSPAAVELLGQVMLMLARVAEHEQVNRMGAKNLAICWAPNLIYDDGAKDQFALLKASLAATELMIREADQLFFHA